MKRWKTALLPLLTALFLVLSLAPAAAAAGTDGAVLRVGAGGAARGETFTLPVTFTGDGVWGGNLDVVYDSAVLELVSAQAGELLEGALFQGNPYFSENSVRISFAATKALGTSGTVCLLTFRVRETAALESSDVSLANVRLYNQDAEACAVTTENGTVQVGYSGITVQSVEAVRGQSVRVNLELNGDLDPTGGSFTIQYDANQMTAGTVVASNLLMGYSLVSNETAPGQIQVSWAGSEALEARGTLCTVTFHVSQQAAGAPTILLQDLRAYDENAQPLDTVAGNGSVTILTPTETSPKLWLVGGSIDPETKVAEINVVLEGRGAICGGQFTLHYPTESCTLDTTQAQVTGAVNTETAGTILFSWADAAPVTGSQVLLRLAFQVADATNIPLTLDSANLLTSDGDPVTNVDIRNGKLLADSLTYQAPAMDAVTVAVDNGQTSVETVLDIAAAHIPAARTLSVLPENTLLLVFYEGEQMKAVSLQESSITLDENGIAQITASASCAGIADSIRIFLLGESGALVPAAEHLCCDLEISGS